MNSWPSRWLEPGSRGWRLGVMALVLVLSVLYGAARSDDKAPEPQPIPFSHKVHAAAGLRCAFCHPIEEPGFTAGLPAESKCMVCHTAVKSDSPDILKVAQAAKAGETIPVGADLPGSRLRLVLPRAAHRGRQDRMRRLPRPGGHAGGVGSGEAHLHGLLHGLPCGSQGFQRLRRLSCSAVVGSGDFLVAEQGGRGDGVPTLHIPATELHSSTEEQATRKSPVPVGDKKVAPPSRRQESRTSQGH